MSIKRIIVLFIALGALTAGLWAQAANAKNTPSDPQAVKIINAYEDKLNLVGLDISNLFTLIQKKPGEADRVLRVQIYRRDGEDVFTFVFQFPSTEKGKGYYRKGDDLYLYLPSTREFVYSNKKTDVGGSDVRVDMFGKQKTLSDYRASYVGSAQVAKWDCDVIRLDAVKTDVSYSMKKIYVRKSDGLPVKEEGYSASGQILRTTYYIDYLKVAEGKYIFTKLMAQDELSKGQKTYLSNESIATKKIPDYTFSKAFLEEQSR